ncbi:MAG: SDR family oxidoreductase [Lachnospiraceae bacterium]|nr:SDR family oxidoreductase [Lachnospiraceae bacterium]
MGNNTVFISGSSRGIGKAIALLFAEKGYNVIINASKSKEELIETQNEIKNKGGSCHCTLCDVSDYEACKRMFEEIKLVYPMPGIIINNAGISEWGLFTDMSPHKWQRLLNVNINSVLNCTHIALPEMVKNKSGIIVNISSIWGETGASCEAVYSASKGAINSFTKSMAKELGPSGIRVNAIACGVIDTKMNSSFDKSEKAALAEEIPLMRFGTPEEVAKLAFFLATEDSSFLNGQVITLDGGMI